MSYTLFHADSSGSVVPLILLRQLNLPHEVVTLDYEETTARKDSPDLRRLLQVSTSCAPTGASDVRATQANPLAQFPTLLTPDGTALTEMAAILLCAWRDRRRDRDRVLIGVARVDLVHRHGSGTSWDLGALTPAQLAVFYRVMVPSARRVFDAS